MTFKERMTIRFRLAKSCVGVILRDKSLLVFPLVSMVSAFTILGFFYLTVVTPSNLLLLCFKLMHHRRPVVCTSRVTYSSTSVP